MFKTLLSVFIAGSVVAIPSHASNILKQLHLFPKTHGQKTLQAQKKAQPKHETYTNFSGDWEGTCNMNDMQSSAETTITNDQYTLIMDGDYNPIGPVLQEGMAGQFEYFHQQNKLIWNADGTLTMQIAQTDADDYDDPFTTSVGHLTFELNVNDELIINGSGYLFSHNEAMEKFVIDCVFTRKAKTQAG